MGIENNSGMIDYKGKILPRDEAQKEFNRDMAEVMWRPEKFVMNDRTVDFLGVIHSPETLEIPRLYEEIKNSIDGAAAVVLESAPRALGHFSDEYLEQLFVDMDELGIEFDKSKVTDKLRNNPVTDFFLKVEEMAAEAGKPVISIDPNSYNTTAQMQLHREDELTKLIKVASFLTFAVPGLYKSIKSYQKFIDSMDPVKKFVVPNQKDKKNEGLASASRRKFLQKLGIAGLAVSGLALAPDIESIGYQQTGVAGRSETSFGPLLYDYIDYRDVAVAEGLDYVTKNYSDILGAEATGPVVGIYGSGHARSVRHYCESETERQAKYGLYLPFKNVAKPVFRCYEHSAEGWELKRSKEL